MLANKIMNFLENTNIIDFNLGLSLGILLMDSFKSFYTIIGLLLLIGSILSKVVEIKKLKRKNGRNKNNN